MAIGVAWLMPMPGGVWRGRLIVAGDDVGVAVEDGGDVADVG